MHSLTIAFQHTCIFFLFAKEKTTNKLPSPNQFDDKIYPKHYQKLQLLLFFLDLLHLFFNSSLVSGIDRLLQLTKAPQGPNPPPCVELGFRRPDKKIREGVREVHLLPSSRPAQELKAKGKDRLSTN